MGGSETRGEIRRRDVKGPEQLIGYHGSIDIYETVMPSLGYTVIKLARKPFPFAQLDAYRQSDNVNYIAEDN